MGTVINVSGLTKRTISLENKIKDVDTLNDRVTVLEKKPDVVIENTVQPTSNNAVSGKAVADYVKANEYTLPRDIECNTLKADGLIQVKGNWYMMDKETTGNLIFGDYGVITTGLNSSDFNLRDNIIMGERSEVANCHIQSNILMGQECAFNGYLEGNAFIGDASFFEPSYGSGNVIAANNCKIGIATYSNVIAGAGTEITSSFQQNTWIVGGLKDYESVPKTRYGLMLVGTGNTTSQYNVYWPTSQPALMHGNLKVGSDFSLQDKDDNYIIKNGESIIFYLQEEINSLKKQLDELRPPSFDSIYPVGAIYLSVSDDSVCPLELLGIGKWEKIEDGRVLQSPFDEYAPGSLVEAGLPDHSHTVVDNAVTSSGFTVGVGVSSLVGYVATTVTKTSSLASKNNPIYGNSSTVQPPALIVNIWKRIS